jgi:exodeoxyribonuclease VII small subunit
MPTAPPSPTSPGPTSPVPVTPVGPDVAALSFEDALSELERIVKGLEGGQQKLDDAIGAYERGTLLRRHCEAKLAEAESRVQAIVEGADGGLSLRAAD